MSAASTLDLSRSATSFSASTGPAQSSSAESRSTPADVSSSMEFLESDLALSEEHVLQMEESDLTVTDSEELNRSHRKTSTLEEPIDEDLVLGMGQRIKEQKESKLQREDSESESRCDR